MGYHISVYIANHCSTDITYTNQKSSPKGDIEDGPVTPITPLADGDDPPLAFTGYRSGSDNAEGWVRYNFPRSTGQTFTIHYGTYTAKNRSWNGEEYGKIYTGGIFVEQQGADGAAYSIDEGYFVMLTSPAFSSPHTDDWSVTVHVYPSAERDSVEVPSSQISTTETAIWLDNQLESWVLLHDYSSPVYTYPTTLQAGTTSVGPGQKVAILNYSESTSGPTFSLDEQVLMQVMPRGSHKAPQCIFPPNAGDGNYEARVSPADDGHNTYTITLSTN